MEQGGEQQTAETKKERNRKSMRNEQNRKNKPHGRQQHSHATHFPSKRIRNSIYSRKTQFFQNIKKQLLNESDETMWSDYAEH